MNWGQRFQSEEVRGWRISGICPAELEQLSGKGLAAKMDPRIRSFGGVCVRRESEFRLIIDLGMSFLEKAFGVPVA